MVFNRVHVEAIEIKLIDGTSSTPPPGVASEDESIPCLDQYLLLRTCRGGANIQRWRSLEARLLLSQSHLVRHANFPTLHDAKKA